MKAPEPTALAMAITSITLMRSVIAQLAQHSPAKPQIVALLDGLGQAAEPMMRAAADELREMIVRGPAGHERRAELG